MVDFLFESLYRVGAHYRNPSLFSIYEELKGSEFLPLGSLKEIQLERARVFFGFIGQHSDYYSSIFKLCGFDAANITSIEDIKKIPVITKPQLIENSQSIHSKYNFRSTFLAETSGTTGSALEFVKDEIWDSTNRAALMRAYDWYGVKPWSANGYLWGFNISGWQARKVRALDFLQNRRRLFSYNEKEIQNFAVKITSAEYLAGYSSMIYEVAKLINKSGKLCADSFPRMKLIKGTSETILDIYRSEVKQAFGLNITSEYGAAEAGLIAFECTEGRLHINIENVIVETNEDDEVIVTNLCSRSFPIVRYNLGDVAILDRGDVACGCGRSHPVIKSLSGRKGASVWGKANKYPALTFYYVFKNLAMKEKIFLNYQVFQEVSGAVEMKIEQPWDQVAEIKLLEQLMLYFEDDLKVEISWGVSFPNNRKKKTQYFNTLLE